MKKNRPEKLKYYVITALDTNGDPVYLAQKASRDAQEVSFWSNRMDDAIRFSSAYEASSWPAKSDRERAFGSMIGAHQLHDCDDASGVYNFETRLALQHQHFTSRANWRYDFDVVLPGATKVIAETLMIVHIVMNDVYVPKYMREMFHKIKHPINANNLDRSKAALQEKLDASNGDAKVDTEDK